MPGNYRAEFDVALERFKRILSPHADELVIALKGHLLIEEKLRSIVRSAVANPEYLDNSRITFSTVLQLSRAFVGHLNDSSCWEAAEKLNSVRNKLAHQVEPKLSAELFSQFFDICESEARWESVHVLPRGKAKLRMYIGVLWATFDALHDVVTVCVEHSPSPLTTRSSGPLQAVTAPER